MFVSRYQDLGITYPRPTGWEMAGGFTQKGESFTCSFLGCVTTLENLFSGG